jgi:hypothetical protein
MNRLAFTAAAIAALAVPSLAQADSPLPPGPPPSVSPPPGSPSPPQAPTVPTPTPTPTPTETTAPPTTPAGSPTGPAPAPPAANATAVGRPGQAPARAAGKVKSIRLRGKVLVVEVACTADAHATLRLTSGNVSIGQKRYRCAGTRKLELRAPGAVVRRAHRKGGADVRAVVSAAGFASNRANLRVRAGSVARAAAVASATQNYMPCPACIEYIFGGFGNTQTLEYWVRWSRDPATGSYWYKENGWWLWWGDAQYYQNYASAYITTYRYHWYWDGSKQVNYLTENIGP